MAVSKSQSRMTEPIHPDRAIIPAIFQSVLNLTVLGFMASFYASPHAASAKPTGFRGAL